MKGIFAPPEDMVPFWHDLWVQRKSPFRKETVLRNDGNVKDASFPGTMIVIRGLPRSFRAGPVMIRDEDDLDLADLATRPKNKNTRLTISSVLCIQMGRDLFG